MYIAMNRFQMRFKRPTKAAGPRGSLKVRHSFLVGNRSIIKGGLMCSI